MFKKLQQTDDNNNCIDSSLLIINAVIFIPNWLNREFIALHLSNYFNNKKIQIIRFEVRPITGSASSVKNSMISMYRVNVSFSEGAVNQNDDDTNLSVIIKTPTSNDELTRYAEKLNKKEAEFYSQIAPKINKSLIHLDEPKQLIPNSYGVCTANNALLLEDLTMKSYCTSSICSGFNLNEAKIVLQKVATFHAINAVLQQQQPNIFDNFKYGQMDRTTRLFDTFYLTQFDTMTEVVSTWPNAHYYLPKFRRLGNKLLERGFNTVNPDPNSNHFNTLIHGDLSSNNIMIKYGSNRSNGVESVACDTDPSTKNTILVDFQYACWTSPTIDLQYLLNTSLQESLRPDRFDDLITYYHGHLESNLKRLVYKSQIPNLNQFKQQFRDKSFYGFITSCLIQPILMNESEKYVVNDELLTSDNAQELRYKREMYSSKRVQTILKKMIPIYDQMGIFD